MHPRYSKFKFLNICCQVLELTHAPKIFQIQIFKYIVVIKMNREPEIFKLKKGSPKLNMCFSKIEKIEKNCM
jgi:hypothetical protein